MKKMQIASWPLSRGGFLWCILWWIFAQFERFMCRQVRRCIQARESGIFLKLSDEWLGICRNYAKSQMLLGHKMLVNDR